MLHIDTPLAVHLLDGQLGMASLLPHGEVLDSLVPVVLLITVIRFLEFRVLSDLLQLVILEA